MNREVSCTVLGQSNVWYRLDANFELRNPPWLAKAIEYVNSYHGDNLIANPEIEITQASRGQVESAAGFESNQRIRSAVEEHAMKIVARHKRGYTVADMHKTESYDFVCAKGGRRRYVEVKGTQTAGNQTLLTANEVKLPDQCPKVDLCVVHSVRIVAQNGIVCRGGTLVLYENWHPRDHRLRPLSFICELTNV